MAKDEQSILFSAIPIGNEKLNSIMESALKEAKNGKKVLIFNIGGKNKLLEPMDNGDVLIKEVDDIDAT